MSIRRYVAPPLIFMDRKLHSPGQNKGDFVLNLFLWPIAITAKLLHDNRVTKALGMIVADHLGLLELLWSTARCKSKLISTYGLPAISGGSLREFPKSQDSSRYFCSHSTGWPCILSKVSAAAGSANCLLTESPACIKLGRICLDTPHSSDFYCATGFTG